LVLFGANIRPKWGKGLSNPPVGNRAGRRAVFHARSENHQDAIMSRQDANAAFALSSFLQGTNAAYIDDLYARYEQNPNSIDSEWQEFFKSLKDSPADVKKNAEGASWGRDHWPLTPRDDLTSALDGNWALVEKAVGAKLAAKAQAKSADVTAADVN